MRIRSIVAMTTATMLTLGSLSACGDAGDSSDAGSGAAGSVSAEGVDDGTTVTMWTRAPLERQAKNAVEAYNASHDNQVQLEILPNDDVEGKVGGAIQTDTLPDLLAGDVVRIPYWVQQGVFTDLTEQIDGLSNKEKLQGGHIDAGTYQDKEYTLPFVTDISVMVWNKDLYKEAGLDPEKGPTNLQEFKEQAKAVAGLNKEGVAGTYLAGQSGGALVFTLFPMVWGSGGEVLNAEGTEATVNSDEMKQVYEAYREIVATPNGMGAGSKEETGATWTAPFQEGKIGVMPYPYTAVTGLFESADFEIGVAPIPGVDGGQSTFLGGDAIGISKNSKNVAQAWNFLQWLMSDEAQQSVFADNDDTAASLNVLEQGYKDADPRTAIANSTIKDGHTPVAAYFNEAFNAAGSNWQLLIQDAIWADGGQTDQLNDAITSTLGS